MPRKQTKFSTQVLERMREGQRCGKSAGEIAAELKAAGVKGASKATVFRRLRDLQRAAVTPPELPGSPDEIPEGADVETLDHWIAVAKTMGEQAQRDKNIAAIGAMGRLVATLLEHRRKAAPKHVDDPNDSLDMIAAAKKAREILHRYVARAVGRD